MSIIDKFRYIAEKKKLKESAPVVTRGGKIGRKGENENLEPYTENTRQVEVISERNVTISDGEFENESIAKSVKKSKKGKIYTSKKSEKSPFPVMTVVFSLICTGLIMSVIINFVQVHEYSRDISTLQKQVENIHKEAGELQAQLDEKNAADGIRDYLGKHSGDMNMVEEGMMKPPVAISPEKDEAINDFEAAEKDEGIMAVVLNALAENLVNVWNIFTGNE